MGSINGQMKPEIGLNNPEIGLNRVAEHGANGANAPEPTGLHSRICAHVDWFLRFVGNKRSVQKELSVSLNALFRLIVPMTCSGHAQSIALALSPLQAHVSLFYA
jgi:hypothetical protein